MINGKEYVKRLRRHFERLHPIPEWANLSVSEKPPPRKRRRVSNSSQSSKTPDSEEDGNFNSEELDTQPLARLLQNAASLVQSHSTNSTRSRKLRPENVDLQRLKDVGSAQQVRTQPFTVLQCLIDSRPHLVICHVARLPSCTPAALKFWSLIYDFITPYISTSTKSESFAYNSPPTRHFSDNITLSPSYRKQDFLLWPPPLLSRMGSTQWQS